MLAPKVGVFWRILGKVAAGTAVLLIIEYNIVKDFAFFAFDVEASIICLKNPEIFCLCATFLNFSCMLTSRYCM